jgi:hypothetical protein
MNKWKQLLLLLLTSVILSCSEQQPKKTSTETIKNDITADSGSAEFNGAPAITFDKTIHDFGNITQGEKAEFSFKFTNTGKGQLLLSNAVASCGCTVPSFSKEPINPGGIGYVKVTFDSDKRLDKFEKSITVTSNTIPAETMLYITGMVIPKPEDQYKILHNKN